MVSQEQDFELNIVENIVDDGVQGEIEHSEPETPVADCPRKSIKDDVEPDIEPSNDYEDMSGTGFAKSLQRKLSNLRSVKLDQSDSSVNHATPQLKNPIKAT